MPTLPETFTTAALKELFDHLQRTYATYTFRDWAGQNGVILRQDVDLDLGLARKFADLQAEAGLRSTFFVLLTSPCYNPMTADSRAILRSLVRDGFEVGLHFDPTADGDPDRVGREASLLSDLSGAPVTSLSLHTPTSRGEFPLYPGFINAYDPKVFTPETYLSDSRFGWRHDPWEFIKRAHTGTVQLVFHPFNYSVQGRGYVDAFGTHLDAYLQAVDSWFRPFNDSYVRQIGPDLKAWYIDQATAPIAGK